MSMFHRPADGIVGDVIPFYWQGLYHAFYLKAPLPPRREGAFHTPWAHLVSSDLAHWEEWPEAIGPGGRPGDADEISCFTGSLIEKDGLFYMFYTGFAGRDKPQTVCLATSEDLRSWHKDERNPLIVADPRWYEAIDWRDPFPFWNEEAGEYWMLLAARELEGPDNRRGCLALMTSTDLLEWTVQPPFWAPRLYFTHECPDLFRHNGQWVLVYSTFSERNITHFRVSDSLAGPWRAPHNDGFDGRAYYAAKTAGDGQRRFVFAWDPTREDNRDSGKWEWGGDMVVHEVTDELGVKPVPALLERFGEPCTTSFEPLFGTWNVADGTYRAAYGDGFSAASLGQLPPVAALAVSIRCDAQTRSCGLLLRTDAALENYYQVRWEPAARRLVFDRWPRPGDEPFILERPLGKCEQLDLRVLIEGSVVVIYANDEVALTCRMYDHEAGAWALFVNEGQATFSDVSCAAG